uniref:Uncharacterized protein n=1 Tax=Steinernema glaseri TaxID=37863 RepID=A0A1I7ZYG9_9BILA
MFDGLSHFFPSHVSQSRSAVERSKYTTPAFWFILVPSSGFVASIAQHKTAQTAQGHTLEMNLEVWG